MNQPPTIPEGDEENEGVEQVGQGNRLPAKNVSQQVPPIHDTVASAADLQTREDSGVGYGQSPTLPNEIVGTSGDDTTHVEEGAEHQQPTTDDGEPMVIEGDGETEGERTEENEVSKNLDESGALDGIQEEEQTVDESARAGTTTDRSMPTLVESPIPPVDEHPVTSPPPQTSHDHLKPGEVIGTHPDEHRRSARSGRERSGRGQRDGPQVDFEKLDYEDEHEQELEGDGPEVRITREQLLSRYQAAEIERDRLKGINMALQQRLADYLHKRKGADDIPALAQGNDRLNAEQQQRYQKYLNEIEGLQKKMKEDQIKCENDHNDMENAIQQKKDEVERLKSNYVKLVKEIASKAVFARSGKAISNQEVENYLKLLREKEEELIKARHENIRLKNQLKKRELQLKSKEELAEGLHMIDFEQLKIENQTYSEKIEERNEELMKLRKKISTTVQILSHIKEKLSFVQQQRVEAESILEEKEKEVKQKRDELASIKRRRDRFRQENQSLKQNSGLIGNEQLLRDYEERYDDIERCTAKLESLKKHHAEVTLMCKVLKKKISKV